MALGADVCAFEYELLLDSVIRVSWVSDFESPVLVTIIPFVAVAFDLTFPVGSLIG